LQYQKGSSHIVADCLGGREYPDCTDDTMDKFFLDQNIHTINGSRNNTRMPTTEARSNKEARPGKNGPTTDKVTIISHEVYDKSGNLMEEIRDLIDKRISYLLLPGSRNEDIKISPQGHIILEDLIVWLTEDCGIMLEEDDIRKTVAECMRDKVAITNGMIYAKQYIHKQEVSTIQARNITERYMTDELQTKTGKRNNTRMPTTETRSNKEATNGQNEPTTDKITIISHEVYDKSGNLMEDIRDLVVKRISCLLLPGSRNEDIKISPQGHIHLEDLIVWLTVVHIQRLLK